MLAWFCLERSADLRMAQLMLLPLTISCFNTIQVGFTFLVPAHLGSPGQRAVRLLCVVVCSSSSSILDSRVLSRALVMVSVFQPIRNCQFIIIISDTSNNLLSSVALICGKLN